MVGYVVFPLELSFVKVNGLYILLKKGIRLDYVYALNKMMGL